MMAAVELTVVITNWNYGRYLERAIGSVRAQIVQPLKVVVIDDASDDESVAICGRLGVEVVRHPLHWGAVAAYNTGLHVCQTEWVIFLDADDELAPSYIYDCFEAAIRCNVPWVYTGVAHINDDGKQIGGERHGPFDLDCLMNRNNFIHSAALVKTDLLRRAGGWWPYHLEDWIMWQRVAALGARAAWVDKPILRYRKHGESRMTSGRGG